MNILYQWVPGAYSHLAALEIEKIINSKDAHISHMSDFTSIWENLNKNTIWIIPVENSYAGNIHENLYNFLKYNVKIIGSYDFKVEHCLLSKNKNISEITDVFSHPQALSQCYEYLQQKNIQPIKHFDTAWAAQMISQNNQTNLWAIASKKAAEVYNLEVLDENIQDQDNNTTRFFIITSPESNITFPENNNKISIIFEANENICDALACFKKNNISITKIESLPNPDIPFWYYYWVDIQWNLSQNIIDIAIWELKKNTKKIIYLWEY